MLAYFIELDGDLHLPPTLRDFPRYWSGRSIEPSTQP
jgi:hypothetical protein